MDNICHTLVGAAIGEAGLKRRTRYGTAALILAANLPDIDVLVFATSTPSVAFRRGWTHGVLAQLLLPIVSTAVIVGIGRLRKRKGDTDAAAESVPWLLALSYIGVLTHVFMDYLNNYGVRVLAPFDWRWFYGDAVFIVDLWLWIALGAGVWLSRRTGRPAGARGAVVFATCYMVVMLASARAARTAVAGIWEQTRGTVPQALMVGPVPVSPFRRDVIVDAGEHYETGTFSWQTGAVTFDDRHVDKNSEAPAVARARETPRIKAFLTWSRFPYWQLRNVAGGTSVTVRDMRFNAGFAATTIVPSDTP